MTTRLRRLQYQKVALVDRGANPEAHISLFKRDTTMAKEPTVAEVQAELSQVVAERNTLREQVAKLTPPREDKVDLPDAVQKRLDEAESRARDAEARIAKMEEGRMLETAIQKAHGFKALGAADDLGRILYDIRKASGTLADKVEALFTAWNEQMGKSDLFREIGSGQKADGDPEARLEALAKKYQAEHAGSTIEGAYSEVCKTAEGKALYAQSLKGGK